MSPGDLIKIIGTSPNEYKHFYHLTDGSNIRSIEKHGLLSASEREKISIEPEKGIGLNPLSSRLDSKLGIDQYVCLSFTYQHPVFKKAIRSDRGVGRIDNPIMIKINPQILCSQEDIVFADGVATANNTKRMPFNQALCNGNIDVKNLYQYVDLQNDEEAQSKRNKAKHYEILIPDQIPSQWIVDSYPVRKIGHYYNWSGSKSSGKGKEYL